MLDFLFRLTARVIDIHLARSIANLNDRASVWLDAAFADGEGLNRA